MLLGKTGNAREYYRPILWSFSVLVDMINLNTVCRGQNYMPGFMSRRQRSLFFLAWSMLAGKGAMFEDQHSPQVVGSRFSRWCWDYVHWERCYVHHSWTCKCDSWGMEESIMGNYQEVYGSLLIGRWSSVDLHVLVLCWRRHFRTSNRLCYHHHQRWQIIVRSFH